MAANKRSKNQQPTYHKMHIKTGDTVQVISGKDKGKVGEILQAIPAKSQVVVKGVNNHRSIIIKADTHTAITT